MESWDYNNKLDGTDYPSPLAAWDTGFNSRKRSASAIPQMKLQHLAWQTAMSPQHPLPGPRVISIYLLHLRTMSFVAESRVKGGDTAALARRATRKGISVESNPSIFFTDSALPHLRVLLLLPLLPFTPRGTSLTTTALPPRSSSIASSVYSLVSTAFSGHGAAIELRRSCVISSFSSGEVAEMMDPR